MVLVDRMGIPDSRHIPVADNILRDLRRLASPGPLSGLVRLCLLDLGNICLHGPLVLRRGCRPDTLILNICRHQALDR